MHSSHESEVLTDDTYNQLINKVKSLSDQLHQQVDACKNETGKVQRLLSDRQHLIPLAVKQINDRADEIISLIRQQRDGLLSALHSHNDQSVHSLKDVSAALSCGLSASRKALRFADELLDKGSVEDMLLNYQILNDRVTRVGNMSRGSSVPDSVSGDVSPTSLVHDVCCSLSSQSKSLLSVLNDI